MSIKNGDVISVHYIGTLNDGTEFDRSSENSPLTFTVGSGQVIEGFDKSVIGKSKGDKFTITIPADEAYGPYDDECVLEIERSQLPDTIKPEVGLTLNVPTDQGDRSFIIIDVTDETLVIDANHPMAGEDLTFEITVL